ncbi:MAG: hypothetical protein ACE5JC_03560 [Candidatus Zixiibacteriota bacterium]
MLDKRKSAAILVLLLLFSLTVISSCGKKSTSSEEEITAGDPNSPEFSQTREMVDDAVGEGLGQFRTGLDFTDGLQPPVLPKLQSPQDTTYQWIYQNGWWWCYIEYSDTSYEITLSDSIQFRSGGEPQMNPDSTTSEMEFRLDTDISCDLYAFTLWYDLIYAGLNADTITVDGDGGYDFSGTYSGYDYYYHFTETLEEVTFAVTSSYEESYPISGTVTLAVVENFTNLSNNDPQGQTGWSIQLTFYSDHYHVRAQQGDTVYEYDENYPV